jgi:hypothetical protein
MLNKYLLLIIIGISQIGCQYLDARMRDFQDCFVVSADAGLGLAANVQLGPIGIGAGYWEGYAASSLGNVGVSLDKETFLGIPLPLSIVLGAVLVVLAPNHMLGPLFPFVFTGNRSLWFNNVSDGGRFPITFGRGRQGRYHAVSILHTGPLFEDVTYHSLRPVDYAWIGCELKCCIGLKFYFNAIEFCDFLLGLVGIDVLDDDARSSKNKHKAQ